MATSTIRIPEDKKNMLKAISSLENKKMNDIIVELIDEYVERHKETIELLSIPGLYENLIKSSEEFRKGKGVSIKDAREKMES
jgi:PHD/YefM family antitoxin component YafN of YafNO toxin-antitoxin module